MYSTVWLVRLTELQYIGGEIGHDWPIAAIGKTMERVAELCGSVFTLDNFIWFFVNRPIQYHVRLNNQLPCPE